MVIPDLSKEKNLWEKGFINVAGVDEAGRGPLAGPVTAGAVMIHSEKQIIPLVRDSKKMTAKQRELAFEEIKEKSTAFGIGIVAPEEIDAIGINKAVWKAMHQALSNIELNFKVEISYVLVDGVNTLVLEKYQSERIKGGDIYHYSISAASVLAKVTRDRIMHEESLKYPFYGFDKHVGYGTKAHFEALKNHGTCPLHRKTFLKRIMFS
jgi:ribonuclease HII